MAAPSDYRHDPFSDVSTAATFTERHIIPSVSPYVINLNEIPQKNSPSTMTVKAITNVNGSTVTYGSTFAEVAANPSSNEFWPDYNTGADGDENWNTGKLLFNSSNAGQLVEIRYTATGTLAGVKSNRYPAWWLDRGDGSDGDFAPTANTTISGFKQYKSVYIPAGVTVTVYRWTVLQCQGAFVVEGTLTANGQGAIGGSESGGTGSNEYAYASFGGAGGRGEAGEAGGAGGGLGIGGLAQDVNAIYIYKNIIIAFGGGGGGGSNGKAGGPGGAGGNGGGCIYIIAPEVKITGSVTANGNAGGAGISAGLGTGGGGGGGGGGCVTIIAHVLNSGIVTAYGGSGGLGGGTGATGGTGLVHIEELGVV